MLGRPLVLATLALLLGVGGCGDDSDNGNGDDGSSPDQAGQACEVPDDCYPDTDPEELSGPALCLDRVPDGYCTHECGSDMDCCAAENECRSDFPQVCSPFESTGMMMCFLSCEKGEVDASDAEDDQEFCQREAHRSFICRSSGGGANNRKVCVPGDCGVGADCTETADCSGDLECLDEYEGGYCGTRGCETNADCGADARCVRDGDGTYCARTCGTASDCSFCRHEDHAAQCTDEADFAEDGTADTVCVPTRN